MRFNRTNSRAHVTTRYNFILDFSRVNEPLLFRYVKRATLLLSRYYSYTLGKVTRDQNPSPLITMITRNEQKF